VRLNVSNHGIIQREGMARATGQDVREDYENRKLHPSQKVMVVFGFRHNNFTD
jgi:hypothetical protein